MSEIVLSYNISTKKQVNKHLEKLIFAYLCAAAQTYAAYRASLLLKANAFKIHMPLCGAGSSFKNLYAGWGATLQPRLRFLAAKSGEKSRPEGFRSPQTPTNVSCRGLFIYKRWSIDFYFGTRSEVGGATFELTA